MGGGGRGREAIKKRKEGIGTPKGKRGERRRAKKRERYHGFEFTVINHPPERNGMSPCRLECNRGAACCRDSGFGK